MKTLQIYKFHFFINRIIFKFETSFRNKCKQKKTNGIGL